MPILVHYGELALKGKNRSLFEKKLIDNIEKAGGGRVTRYQGRLVVENGDISALKTLFGISWFAPAYKVERDLESIKKLALSKVLEKANNFKTFGVFVKRTDKSFPYDSLEIANNVGQAIVDNINLRVNLKSPELSVYIEIAEDAFLFLEKFEGLGGLPVGMSGKVLCLLSGGIDSPVAAYLMMKRGAIVDHIHFHSYSDSERVVRSKIKEIVQVLQRYQGETRLFLVPYAPFQMGILRKKVDRSYEMVLFRRFMVKIAERIARRYGYQALISGDSLGQVASQTLENLSVFNEAVTLPILQPLISFDKCEIIDLAKKICSYEASIKPYNDCCSILASNPKTKTRLERINLLEEKIDLEKVIDEALDKIRVYKF